MNTIKTLSDTKTEKQFIIPYVGWIACLTFGLIVMWFDRRPGLGEIVSGSREWFRTGTLPVSILLITFLILQRRRHNLNAVVLLTVCIVALQICIWFLITDRLSVCWSTPVLFKN